MCKDTLGEENFMFIDFDKVNKRGYDDSENGDNNGDPFILFKKPGVDPNKEMSLTFIINIYDSMIIATISKPNELKGLPTPLYTVAMDIADGVTEDTLDTFFEFTVDHFFVSIKTDYQDCYRKALEFIKDSELDIKLIKLKDFISSDGGKKCRTFTIEGNEMPFIENNDSDAILVLSVKGYGVFELYADCGVLFNIPDEFGTDETVTSDITHILKCMREFRTKINVLGLFSTVEEQCATFNEHLKQLGEKLSDGLSINGIDDNNDEG